MVKYIFAEQHCSSVIQLMGLLIELKYANLIVQSLLIIINELIAKPINEHSLSNYELYNNEIIMLPDWQHPTGNLI